MPPSRSTGLRPRPSRGTVARTLNGLATKTSTKRKNAVVEERNAAASVARAGSRRAAAATESEPIRVSASVQ